MFTPTIDRNTLTAQIKEDVARALVNGETVRLGRWTACPMGLGRVEIVRWAEESRGPGSALVGAVSAGSASPERVGAGALVRAWLGDW
jgi:hypothetical protein